MQLIRCEGGQLCVWHPSEKDKQWLEDQQIAVTWIASRHEDAKEVDWLGKGHHGYNHLPSLTLAAGSTTWLDLETSVPEVTPKAVFHTGPRQLLAWCMIDTPEEHISFLSELALAYGSLGGDPLSIAPGPQKSAD